jgi:Uri superfamily endonuclease
MLKGIYLLYLKLEKTQDIEIGMLGLLRFKEGSYLYIGSARNGIIQRVSRHLKRKKKLFWHIDYFLNSYHASVESVYYVEDKNFSECDIVKKLQKEYFKNSAAAIKGFGSSDCRCISHFFYLLKEFNLGILTI